MGNLSGRLATMLAAMPYAMAAKFAHPDRPVVCTIGDGAFQMLGMNGLITVKRHWQQWANPTFIVLVLHNDDLNQVSWEMREVGDPRWDTAQLVESMDYAEYARLLGLRGHHASRTRTRSTPPGSGRSRRTDRCSSTSTPTATSRRCPATCRWRRPWASRSRCCAGTPRRVASSPRAPGRWRASSPRASVSARMTDPDTSLGASPDGAPQVEEVRAAAFTIPLEQPETDGTLRWDSTTLVVVTARAGGTVGTGWTYNAPATASVVADTLAGVVEGRDPMAVGAAWGAMARAVRNQGRRGVVSSAISALDVALWDLKARLLDLSLVDLLGGYHAAVPAYGSGGFTSLTDDELAEQLGGWAEEGLPAVKLKVGRDPEDDPRRVALARATVGEDVGLFVDGNGAYRRKEALLLAERFAEHDVRWFEEPVSSDDLRGLRLVRDRAPAGMDVTAGEYGWDVTHVRDLIAAGAVDCLQADVTRVGRHHRAAPGGRARRRRGARRSPRTAPRSSSAHAMTAVWHARHLEYFADHVRVEALAFDGVLRPQDGALRPDRQPPRSRPRGPVVRPRAVPGPTRRRSMTTTDLPVHWDGMRTVERTEPADDLSARGRALAEALEGRIEGEVRFDDGSRAAYSTDASNYRQVPLGVVVPRTLDDVVTTVAACREHGVPLTNRGGGTSLAGQTCNVGVVIDFCKYLNTVESIDVEDRSAWVLPGCTLDWLRGAAAEHGLTYGPDPATHNRNTLGGMIGNNSCGTHSVMAEFYGPGPLTVAPGARARGPHLPRRAPHRRVDDPRGAAGGDRRRGRARPDPSARCGTCATGTSPPSAPASRRSPAGSRGSTCPGCSTRTGSTSPRRSSAPRGPA